MTENKLEWQKTTKRFVTFFDIMGFKDMVQRNTHQKILSKLESLKKILKFLENVSPEDNKELKKLNTEKFQTRSVTFSDSIIFFSKGDKLEDLQKITADSYALLSTALKKNIGIKGAIAFGEITVDERLRDVRVDNRDAIELIKMFLKRPATLMYIDPPYLGDRTLGYTNDANDEEFHLNLLKTAHKARCMIFISGYDNELYNSELTKKKGWSKRTIDTTTKDINGKEHSREEVVWMNKYYVSGYKTKKLLLRLTKEELKQKKVNPERER